MKNRFGLDSRYFKEKLGQLVRDADNYRPDEMRRALDNLADVARHQENELKPISERMVGGDLDTSYGY